MGVILSITQRSTERLNCLHLQGNQISPFYTKTCHTLGIFKAYVTSGMTSPRPVDDPHLHLPQRVTMPLASKRSKHTSQHRDPLGDVFFSIMSLYNFNYVVKQRQAGVQMFKQQKKLFQSSGELYPLTMDVDNKFNKLIKKEKKLCTAQ